MPYPQMTFSVIHVYNVMFFLWHLTLQCTSDIVDRCAGTESVLINLFRIQWTLQKGGYHLNDN